jgi:hypothetical protein
VIPSAEVNTFCVGPLEVFGKDVTTPLMVTL